MSLTLKEAIQAKKLKLIATELESLARKDRSVKKIVDTLKKGQEPKSSDIKSLKGDTQDEVVMAFASVLGPSQTTKFLGEEKKTIKVGEDAVGAKNTHYVIVKDRKVIAKGDKEEMMEKCGEGERVWLSTKDVGDMVEGKEDPDIGDRKGSQPARYHSGLSKSTKEKRDAQFKKQAKMSDDDPDAYKPAPGDKEAKTKESKYTKKYKEMFGESATQTALQKKSEDSGIAYGILKDVYDRGVAAWRTGHRPGTTAAQWGMARVNSFITGGKTRSTADKDLWKKHKGKNEEFEMSDHNLTEAAIKASVVEKEIADMVGKQNVRMKLGHIEFKHKGKTHKIPVDRGYVKGTDYDDFLEMQESVELDEAVRVDDSRYKRSHKKAPKGKGLWGFTTKPMGAPKESETYMPAVAMDYKQAVEMGKKWADRQGSSVVYVMESVSKNTAQGYANRGRSTFKSMHKMVKGLVRADDDMVTNYLDSTHGRHLADAERDMTATKLKDYIKKDFSMFKKKYDPKLFEAKAERIERGDTVRIKSNPKNVVDKEMFGKSGVVMGKMGRDFRVKFANGRSLMVDPKDLEMVGETNDKMKTFRKQDDIRKMNQAERIKQKKIMKGYKFANRKPMSEANEEDMEPASPDEKSMALKQAEFIQYVGREIGEHLVANKEFPEWMQNKLSALHQKAKDMHATLGAHGGDEMEEAFELDEANQKLFMFDNKKDAQAKAKEIRGKMMELGPKNFAVITKDLTVVREEVELDESATAKIYDAAMFLKRVLGFESAYERRLRQTRAGAKNLKKGDIEAFVKDAEPFLNFIKDGKARYYKGLLRKLKMMDQRIDKLEGEDKTMLAMDAIDRMIQIRNYISKNKTQLQKQEANMSNYNYRTEAHNPMLVSKAVRIAKSMGGDMTGAVEKIEKIAKGLADHPKVKDALRMANEEFVSEAKVSPMDVKRALQIVRRYPRDIGSAWDRIEKLGGRDLVNHPTVKKALHGMSGKLRNEEVVSEKAESEAQAIAARIALKHKREGTQPEKGSASAEMMKMSEKDLEDFTKMKKGAPYKVEEDFTELLYGIELNENFRTLARLGMGTEPRNSRTKTGLELDYYDKDGSKRSGKIIKVDAKGYTVKDDRDGKTHSFSFLDRMKAKELLSKYGKGQYNEALDPVDKDALKKKFKNRKDKDIDNDGDVDSSDEYLHKRRSAISKAIAKEESDTKLKEKDVDRDGDTDDLDKSLKKRQQKAVELE